MNKSLPIVQNAVTKLCNNETKCIVLKNNHEQCPIMYIMSTIKDTLELRLDNLEKGVDGVERFLILLDAALPARPTPA